MTMNSSLLSLPMLLIVGIILVAIITLVIRGRKDSEKPDEWDD